MERDDYEEMDRQKNEILQRQDEGIIGPYVKRISELKSQLEAAMQDMANNETLIAWKRECELLKNRLEDADTVIQLVSDSFTIPYTSWAHAVVGYQNKYHKT